MIAFAICIGSRETYERYAQPGLALHGEADSAVAEITTDSMFAGYNEALEAFSGYPDLEALVLLHEDVEIRDPAFCAKVRSRLADPTIGVIGAIGAAGVRSLCWWEGEIRGTVRETRSLIDHGVGCWDVDAVDGLLMVLSPWVVRNLRFDASSFHGFNGYDVDFCFQTKAARRRVVVDDLTVVHHTRVAALGDGSTFWHADKIFRRKWAALGRDLAGDVAMSAGARRFATVEPA